MFLIDSGLNLIPLFSKIDPENQKEIIDFINFLKIHKKKSDFENYKISEKSFSIFSAVLDELIKKIE